MKLKFSLGLFHLFGLIVLFSAGAQAAWAGPAATTTTLVVTSGGSVVASGGSLAFLNACVPGGYQLAAFRGAQFYPFPARLSRLLAGALPTFAFTIFLLIRKTAEYDGGFVTYPARAELETNFWTGNASTGSQYWDPAPGDDLPNGIS